VNSEKDSLLPSSGKIFFSLYFDEDVSAKVIASLKNRGFDVSSAQDAGLLGKTDEEQLRKAILDGRVLVTHNKKHFIALHEKYISSGKKHYGIIVATRRRDYTETIKSLLHLINTTTPEDMENHLRFI